MNKEIENAVKEFNEHKSKAIIIYDYEDKTVWTDRFNSDSESNDYGNELVLKIIEKSEIDGQMGAGNLSVERLKRAINNFENNKDKYDSFVWDQIEWSQEY